LAGPRQRSQLNSVPGPLCQTDMGRCAEPDARKLPEARAETLDISRLRPETSECLCAGASGTSALAPAAL